ncbi:MAG TPA: sel1 repeat family protein [Rudaea sp.]|nr:sel1 repeat family protein [Rudaea sp.]
MKTVTNHFGFRARFRSGYAVRTCILLVGLTIISLAWAADDPAKDPEVQKTLEAMHNASTWFHPDLYGMTQGFQDYAAHRYKAAIKHFEYGALYADKLSQLCLGLMYLNGEGTAKDPGTALAWLELAAERGYPQFVATRDQVARSLNLIQRERAKKAHEILVKRYGDAVAKHRMAVQLRQGMMNFTGSRTGYDSGVVQISPVKCGPALVIGGRLVPQIGCGAMNDFLAKDNWEPRQYFAARDREWFATVKVGPMTQVDAKATGTKKTGEAGTGKVD